MITLTIMNDFNNKSLYEHRVFNTGDEVWISIKTGKVVKLTTSDGIEWSEEQSSSRK
jgi:hypothetical protein